MNGSQCLKDAHAHKPYCVAHEGIALACIVMLIGINQSLVALFSVAVQRIPHLGMTETQVIMGSDDYDLMLGEGMSLQQPMAKYSGCPNTKWMN